MTELLPNGDKVEVYLNRSSVTVPSGKTWKVTFYVDGNGSDSDVIDADGNSILCFNISNTVAAYEITLHENWKIDGYGMIAGWEFDYSA